MVELTVTMTGRDWRRLGRFLDEKGATDAADEVFDLVSLVPDALLFSRIYTLSEAKARALQAELVGLPGVSIVGGAARCLDRQ